MSSGGAIDLEGIDGIDLNLGNTSEYFGEFLPPNVLDWTTLEALLIKISDLSTTFTDADFG